MKRFLSLIMSVVMMLTLFSCLSFSAFAETSLDENSVSSEEKYTGWVAASSAFKDGDKITVNDSTVYYYVNGKPVKYLNKIDGKYYYFNSNGLLKRGFIRFKEGLRYFDDKGVMQTGWKTINGKTYFFNSNGVAAIYTKNINNSTYYFDGTTSVMHKGWLRFIKTNKWRYFNAEGKMVTGWQTIGGKKYYFDKNGYMLIYTQKINGKTYYFTSKGNMLTGWVKNINNGTWRYFDKNGVMQTGWLTLGNKKYYLNSSGIMQTGWQTIDGKKYFFANSGEMKTGYVNIYATYSTKYTDNANRTNNLKVASNAISGTILKPGDTFDFNKVVGWRTAERGYKKAPVFIGSNKSGLGYGGGVCQVSSTLFNAALLSNMTIVERHQHSQKVSYVPYGRDAAISGSEKNMRFKNNTPYNIKIEMIVNGGVITATLYTQEQVSPPKVTLDVNKNGKKYTLKRYVNGTNNYTTSSTY